jgi:hypothetical protein
MEIDWNTIPEWVNWVTTDRWGTVTYWEEQPTATEDGWMHQTHLGRQQHHPPPNLVNPPEVVGWEEMLEGRPRPPEPTGAYIVPDTRLETLDWRTIPWWASWATIDRWGTLSYWEHCPRVEDDIWDHPEGRRAHHLQRRRGPEIPNWQQLIQERPQGEPLHRCIECGTGLILWTRYEPVGSEDVYCFVTKESYYCTICETETTTFEQEEMNERRATTALRELRSSLGLPPEM